MSFFGDIERFVAELYPYRWPFTIGALIFLAAVLGLAYRRGWHFVVWRHRLASGLVAAALLAMAVPAGDYFLSPLWERSFLEEPSPLAVAAEGTDQPDIIPETPSPSEEPSPLAVATEATDQPDIIPETPSPSEEPSPLAVATGRHGPA